MQRFIFVKKINNGFWWRGMLLLSMFTLISKDHFIWWCINIQTKYAKSCLAFKFNIKTYFVTRNHPSHFTLFWKLNFLCFVAFQFSCSCVDFANPFNVYKKKGCSTGTNYRETIFVVVSCVVCFSLVPMAVKKYQYYIASCTNVWCSYSNWMKYWWSIKDE